MSENIALDRDDFEKLKQQAKRARADYMRRCGTVFIESSRHIVPQCIGAFMRAHQAVAVVAVLLISFGVTMFILSAPTAEAGAHPNMKTLPTANAHIINNSMRIGEPPYP